MGRAFTCARGLAGVPHSHAHARSLTRPPGNMYDPNHLNPARLSCPLLPL